MRNGRTGRILCVLYLVKQGLLKYYRLLQPVREHDTWEDWVCYMLDAVEGTARQGIATFLRNDLGVTRLTATRYLDALVADGILEKRRIGRSNYYNNTALYAILTGEGMTDNGV